MKTGRLEAFSDGVVAIIITIMVLEIEVPVGIGSSWISPWIAGGFFILVALMWLIPDKRIEKNL